MVKDFMFTSDLVLLSPKICPLDKYWFAPRPNVEPPYPRVI